MSTEQVTGSTKMRERTQRFVLFALSPLPFALSFFCALLVAISSFAQGQAPVTMHRIGVLRSGSASTHAFQHEAFRQALRELGYVEGKNIAIEYRFAEGKLGRLPQLAADLLHLKVDAIVVAGIPVTRAARQVTSTIPIVVAAAGDLVRAGLVASLAKPGENITGSTGISPDLSGKRLELLMEVAPKTSRVSLL